MNLKIRLIAMGIATYALTASAQFGGFGGNRNRVSYTEAVVPHTKNYGTIKKQFQVTLPENSIGIIKLTPTK